MAAEIIKKLEAKGLNASFVVNNQGQIFCSREITAMQSEITQMATVIFETIGAVGDLEIDRIQIMGGSKGVIAEINRDQMIGTMLNGDDFDSVKSIFSVLEGLKAIEVEAPVKTPEPAAEKAEPVPEKEEKEEIKKPVEKPVVKPVEAPAEKQKFKLDAGVLDTMKTTLKDYVGDFSERIFNNQMKAQRIKTEELYDEDARRLIFALGKAAGMIIGPSKGRDMTNKLLALLK